MRGPKRINYKEYSIIRDSTVRGSLKRNELDRAIHNYIKKQIIPNTDKAWLDARTLADLHKQIYSKFGEKGQHIQRSIDKLKRWSKQKKPQSTKQTINRVFKRTDLKSRFDYGQGDIWEAPLLEENFHNQGLLINKLLHNYKEYYYDEAWNIKLHKYLDGEISGAEFSAYDKEFSRQYKKNKEYKMQKSLEDELW